METENIELKEGAVSPADQLRSRADDLGMFAWASIFLCVVCGAAAGYGIVNSQPWWPISASASSLAFFLALALFLFAHLTLIRAELMDRKAILAKSVGE